MAVLTRVLKTTLVSGRKTLPRKHKSTRIIASIITPTSYYNNVTDLFEYAWAQSFHFSRFYKGEAFAASLARHEHYLSAQLHLRPGMRVLDVGCGIGGPAREIARFSDANIVGVNFNEFQIGRARRYTKSAGLENQVQFLCHRATVHAPSWEGVYGEILKVLKPGGVRDGIPLFQNIGLWLMRSNWVAVSLNCDPCTRLEMLLRRLGSKSSMRGPAERPDPIPWYYRLEGDVKKAQSAWDYFLVWQTTWTGKLVTHNFFRVLGFLRIIPKARDALAEAGKKKLFTNVPCYRTEAPPGRKVSMIASLKITHFSPPLLASFHSLHFFCLHRLDITLGGLVILQNFPFPLFLIIDMLRFWLKPLAVTAPHFPTAVRKVASGLVASGGVYKDLTKEEQVDSDNRIDNYTDVVKALHHATDLVQYGWAQSFHFSRFYKGETFARLLLVTSTIFPHMRLRPGMRVLDVGCGVGGPAREIARFSDAKSLCNRGYCPCPPWEGVYGEILKVLKPGGVFGTYEWCMTDRWDPSIPEHRTLAHGIELGNGIPEMRPLSKARDALKTVGFQSSMRRTWLSADPIPWYYPLEGDVLVVAGKKKLFTPMYLAIARKPPQVA
ncbi:S-adenosyl-L-methionine-dependent methyltransferase [Lactifluus volemus]|nr:S-adenosyl-L-methionine-dependent methyltransferase [Lactifluus volemus]